MHDHDLVGGPFSVLESDPGNVMHCLQGSANNHVGVFTTLVRSLGIPNIEVVEVRRGSLRRFFDFDLSPLAL